MKVFLFLSTLPLAMAFAPPHRTQRRQTRITTELAMDRRDLFLLGLVIAATPPQAVQAKPASTWFYDEKIEQVFEPSQMATDGRLDLNAAFVGEYKYFPGMFPHAAGKLASNGPYRSVQDIYKIQGLTSHDIELFKKYEHHFTTNPPGRAFTERINARVST